ncbi:MAG TPA: DNA methyltransferase [Acetobacteraceae bacterium]|nr:DNA methyltransferase [Acetobacteraceae bacterium]
MCCSPTQGPQVVYRAPGSLRINPRNPRVHSKKQIRQIANSIRATGFIGAVIVDENDFVLAGVGRLHAAEMLELPLVPTLTVAGLKEAQKRAFSIADNKLTENAGWDRDLLVQELTELAPLLEPLNWDLTLTGFEATEIDALFMDLGDERPDPADTVPAIDKFVVTRTGDLWLMRNHRVLCADARSQSDLDRLMGAGRAKMGFLDVPYNVRIADVQGRGRIKHPEFAHASGEMSSSEYVRFLEQSLTNAARVSADGSVHFVCNDWRHIADLITAAGTVYGTMLNLCVWAKTPPGQGSFYRSAHELIGVFRVGNEVHQNNIQLGTRGRNRSNVWSYPGVVGFGGERSKLLAMHPTTKPVALIADAMRDCTTKNDIVLDTFVGSGSTIMAAEKVGRHGYGLDCEPRYIDVTIRRWQAFTKAEAILDGDGSTFAEIEAERRPIPTDGNQSKSHVVDGHDQEAQANDYGGDWVSLCDIVAMPVTKADQS